jgi:hypothetical protein
MTFHQRGIPMPKPNTTQPKQPPKPKIDSKVLYADILHAVRTRQLPQDPDRRQAVLNLVEVGRILRSIGELNWNQSTQ